MMTASTQNPAQCHSRWGLSAASVWLAGPFEAVISEILSTEEAEAAFMGRSWKHSHALLAVVDLCRPVGAEVHAIRTDFLSMRPTAFVAKWSGLNVAGLGRTFNKLGAERPPSPGVYRTLLHLLCNASVGAKVLRQAPKLSFQYIRNLSFLPDQFRNLAFEDLEPVSAFRVRRAAAAAQLLMGSKNFGRRNLREFLICLMNDYHDTAGNLLARSHFPPPPWEGERRLKPISNCEEMEAAATQFRNCAKTYAGDIVRGVAAIYVWQEEEIAMVELAKLTSEHWVCMQILGISNAQVSEATEERIMAAFPKHLVLGATG